MSNWSWASASVRGTSHVKSGTRCQDAHQCRLINGSLIAIVSDGAGSAQYGGEGASLVARGLMKRAETHFGSSLELPDDALIWDWIDEVRDLLSLAAERRGVLPRAFASTLVGVLATSNQTLVMHIGDGVAAMRMRDDAKWTVPLWPAHGEYASTTYFVVDEPAPQLRLHRSDNPAEVIVAMSDGLERLALNFADEQAHAPFFDGIIKPVAAAQGGRSSELSLQLQNYLDSAPINARTDDDKTLVIAARK